MRLFRKTRDALRSSGGLLVSAVCLAVVAMALAACGDSDGGNGSSSGGEQQNFVWLFYGPKDDGGWNQANWDPAEQEIEERFGDQVEQSYTDNIPYDSKLTQIAEQAVASGATLLNDTVAGGDLFTRVCEKYPDVACLEINPPGPYPNIASTSPENVSAIFPEFWNQEFMMGVAAGLVTESNTVGFLAPYKIPLASSVQNSFLLGCQSVNPKCELRSILINAYYDPPAETRAANTLIDAGADVIHGLVDDPAFCQAAEERGVWAIGQWRDYSDACPEAWLTSPIWDFSDAYLNEVQLLVDGEWTGHRTTWLKLGEGANIADMNPAAGEQVVAEYDDAYQSLLDGENPFVGPLYDTDGKLMVEEGESLTKDQLYRDWNWKLQGTVD